jgi:hypothetical protein
MARITVSILAMALALVAQPAAAQNMETYERLSVAMESAQAQAEHPGDDALACDQLEAEAVSIAQDPTLQNMAVQAGAYSQERIDEMNRASAQMRRQAGLSMFLGIAGGLVSAFVPGAGMATGLAQQAQAGVMQRQAQQTMAQSMTMVEQMIPALPQMMRGQRVYELAQGKQCAFLQQAEAQTP